MGTKVFSRRQLILLSVILVVGCILLLLVVFSRPQLAQSGQLEKSVSNVTAVLIWKTLDDGRCEIDVDFTGETRGITGVYFFRDKPCTASDIAKALENRDAVLGELFVGELPDWMSEVMDQFIAELANYR